MIAWRRLTWVDFVALWFAFDKWIADHSIGTRTNRTVIHRFTCCTVTAHIWTWVNAFVVHTSLRSFAIRTDDALRMTAGAGR